MNIHRVFAYYLFSILGLLPASAEAAVLTGVTQINYQAATCRPINSSQFDMTNVRAVSSTTTLADYIIYQFTSNAVLQQLNATNAVVYPQVGVYYEDDVLFIKNVPRAITLLGPNGTTNYASDTSITVPTNATKPYVFKNLAAGTSLNITMLAESGPFNYALTETGTLPGADSFALITLDPGYFEYYDKIPILKSGPQYLWLTPQNAGTTVNVNLRFANENGSTLGTLVTGQSLSYTFRPYVRDYAKWQIKLVKGQNLSLNVSSSTTSDILNFYVIGSDNTKQYEFDTFVPGTHLEFTGAPSTGVYYVVIGEDETYQSATFDGTVTVTP